MPQMGPLSCLNVWWVVFSMIMLLSSFLYFYFKISVYSRSIKESSNFKSWKW